MAETITKQYLDMDGLTLYDSKSKERTQQAIQDGAYNDAQIKADIKANSDAIKEMYTNEEIDSAITYAVANANHLKRTIVDALPEVASADDDTIYMVSIVDGTGNQKYEEFMLINGAFEKIGDSAADLTDYAKKTEVTTAESNAKTYTDGKVTDLANGQVETNKTDISTLKTKVETLESTTYTAITEAQINALFATPVTPEG